MTENEKRQVANVLAVGCPIETAAAFVGAGIDEVEREQQRDPDFAKRLAQAAAGVEVTHVQNLKDASKDTKNWRVSVWWLERCAPEKYGKRDPRAISFERFENLRAAVLEAIDEEVFDAGDRQRLRRKLEQLATGVAANDQSPPNADDSDETDDATT